MPEGSGVVDHFSRNLARPGWVHFTFVLDESNSMKIVKLIVETGLNIIFGGLRAHIGTAAICTFNRVAEWTFRAFRMAELPEYVMRNSSGTALYDAIYKGIADTYIWYIKLPASDRPGTVVVVIVTDGGEYDSVKYDKAAVAALIKWAQDVLGWQIVFLGPEATVRDAQDMGVPKESTLSFTNNPEGARSALNDLNTAVTGTVTHGKKTRFTDS